MTVPMTGSIDRIEVITSLQRRRRWSAEEKARIVQETLRAGHVSLVARQHGVAPNQVFTWRRLYAEGALSAIGAGEEVVAASEYRALQHQVRELQRLLGKKTLETEILREVYEDWCCLDKRIETVTGEIEQLSQAEARCRRLMSVPGVGPLISTAVVAAINTGEAFECGRDFAAWLGLVPRQHSTGGRTVLGRISKRGSRYLRMLFIQAAKVLLMRPHNWVRYSFGTWLKTASERLHRNKLAVALANKLARIAWSVLRHDKVFDTHLDAAAI